jgi:hypothetical protein
LLRINVHHAQQVAYYLKRLRDTPDGDGSLLDHIVLYYGAGMCNGNHVPENLPLVLLGDVEKPGRHLTYPGTTPLANLHTTVLHKLGMRVERLHDATGPLNLA